MALIVLVGRQGIVWHMKSLVGIMGGWLRKGFVEGMRGIRQGYGRNRRWEACRCQ